MDAGLILDAIGQIKDSPECIDVTLFHIFKKIETLSNNTVIISTDRQKVATLKNYLLYSAT